MAKFTKGTKLAELLDNSKVAEVLAKHKVPCLGCPFAQIEMNRLKIGEICKMYGIKLESLLKDLNKIKS